MPMQILQNIPIEVTVHLLTICQVAGTVVNFAQTLWNVKLGDWEMAGGISMFSIYP